MSIYATRSKRPVPRNPRAPNVSDGAPRSASNGALRSPSDGALRSASDGASSAMFGDAQWTARRKATPADGLLPWSLLWLEGLPPTVRPLALATKFPRIVNRLAAGWNEPSACWANFDELVYDYRGERQGFPTDVYRDLLALRDYYYGFSPKLALQA